MMNLGDYEAGPLRPGDIILVSGKGWMSKAICKLTRSPGEAPTTISHVGIAVDNWDLVEALTTGVQRRSFLSSYKEGQAQVYRPLNIPREDRLRMARAARAYVGDCYGWGKIIMQTLDGLLGGARVFRRLCFVNNFPICSYLVAQVYGGQGYSFGVASEYTTPDDIADFVQSNPNKYRRVL